MRLTVVVDPASATPAEHCVEAGPDGVLIGSADDAHVVVRGLAPHHVRVRVIDARLTVHALAPGVRVRDAAVDPLRGRQLDMHQAAPLLRDDVVRLVPPAGEPRELRVEVGLTALGGRRALARGAPLAAFLFVVLSGRALQLGLPGLASLVAFALLLEATVAAATLAELWVARAGPTWQRRVAAGLATTVVVTLGMTAAAVNLEHARAVSSSGVVGALDVLAGCGARAVAHRLLALGLVAAVVLDARWSRWPAAASTFWALFAGPVVWFAALFAISPFGLPREAGDVVWASNMEEGGYAFASLVACGAFAFLLATVQRRWPVG